MDVIEEKITESTVEIGNEEEFIDYEQDINLSDDEDKI